MKIRKAQLKDASQMYNLMKISKEVHLTENIYSKNFVKKIIKNKGTYAIVAEENGKIVGLLTGAIWKNLGASYWDMLIVDKKFRRKNIGERLYNNYKGFLKKNKMSYIWLLTKPDNKTVEKMLKKFKFKKRSGCCYYDIELK